MSKVYLIRNTIDIGYRVSSVYASEEKAKVELQRLNDMMVEQYIDDLIKIGYAETDATAIGVRQRFYEIEEVEIVE